jgi:hypothetical protein
MQFYIVNFLKVHVLHFDDIKGSMLLLDFIDKTNRMNHRNMNVL